MLTFFKIYFTRTLAVYLLLCCGFYFFQQLFFFHPKVLPPDYRFSFTQNFEETQMVLDEKTMIDVVQFKPADTVAKGVVLYFHGNRNNIERYAEYAPNFTKYGYECWMVDYPGYGKSSGELTQDMMQNLTIKLYDLATQKYESTKVIIYGKSLGTGLAAYLASVKEGKQLILETPYYSMASLAHRYTPFLPVSLLLKMNFTTGEYFKTISEPITIFHGLQDEVIPFTNAMRLIPGMKKGDCFVSIPGGKHNDLPSKKIYQTTLDSLMQLP
jgi:uncharacterized protein